MAFNYSSGVNPGLVGKSCVELFGNSFQPTVLTTVLYYLDLCIRWEYNNVDSGCVDRLAININSLLTPRLSIRLHVTCP